MVVCSVSNHFGSCILLRLLTLLSFLRLKSEFQGQSYGDFYLSLSYRYLLSFSSKDVVETVHTCVLPSQHKKLNLSVRCLQILFTYVLLLEVEGER